jgi:hypothetical protein
MKMDVPPKQLPSYLECAEAALESTSTSSKALAQGNKKLNRRKRAMEGPTGDNAYEVFEICNSGDRWKWSWLLQRCKRYVLVWSMQAVLHFRWLLVEEVLMRAA